MFTHSYATPNATSLTDQQEIVSGFYGYLNQLEPLKINTSAALTESWTTYVSTLSENNKIRAQELAHITTHSTQTIPKAFSINTILKAVFLMAIPELALKHHTGIEVRRLRIDEILDTFEYIELESSYKLTIGENNTAALRENFNALIVNNQIALETQSIFKKYETLLNHHTLYDKYTVAKFSILFLNDIASIINTIFSEPDVSKAITNTQLDYATCIADLHNILAWWLDCYISEVFPLVPPSDEDENAWNQFEKEAHLTTQYKIHINAARNVYHYFPAQGSIEEIIKQYQEHIIYVISLILAPAIIKKDIIFQEKCYSLLRNARLQFHNTRDQARNVLGLSTNETPEKFICDDYEFPDYVFSNPIFINYTDEAPIINYFFIASIGFLCQVDKNKCDRSIYEAIMQRLWNAFIDDERFPDCLRERILLMDISKKIDEYSNPLKFTKQFLLGLSTTAEEKITKEENKILNDLIKYIKSNTGYSKTIIAALTCKGLHFEHRLTIASAIAAYKLTIPRTKQTNDNIYRGLVNIGKKICENDITILINKYLEAKSKKRGDRIFKTHIAILCSQEQLKTLEKHLSQFFPKKNRNTFFELWSKNHPFEEVVSMIKKKADPVKILLELKKRVQASESLSGQTDNLKLLRDFFETDESAERKTIQRLLEITEECSNYFLNPWTQDTSQRSDIGQSNGHNSSSPATTTSSIT